MGHDQLEPLYPSHAKDFRVVEGVCIPGFPLYVVPVTQGAKDVHEFYGDRLLAEFAVQEGSTVDRLALVDKLHPHGLYDMMVLASDSAIKSSVTDLSAYSGRFLLQTASCFVDLVSSQETTRRFELQDGCFHLCYNYDPDTVDRESGMAEKRFHMHLNYWSGRELGSLSTRDWGSIENLAWRRRLLDPIAFLGARIAYDALGPTVEGFSVLAPDHDRDLLAGLPAGLKIRLDDWAVLRTPELLRLLRTLHSKMKEVYDQICHAFTGEITTSAAWRRAPLLARNEIINNLESLHLSFESKRGLTALARVLRNISPRTMNFLRRHKWLRVRHLSLGGLNYSLGMYSQGRNRTAMPLNSHSPVYLVLQTKMFADMGGAGVAYMDNIPIVRIKRGEGVFASQQIKQRSCFHREFIEAVRQRIGGLEEITEVGRRGQVETICATRGLPQVHDRQGASSASGTVTDREKQ